ncbi:hypothetical protein Tco_1000986 [Tanacetum coccineum]
MRASCGCWLAPDNMKVGLKRRPEMEEEEKDRNKIRRKMREEERWEADEQLGRARMDTNFLIRGGPLYPQPPASDSEALVQHIEEEDVRADNKRLKMMLDCSENRTRDAWREHDRATWHYHHLRRWSIMVNNLLPLRLRYQEPPYALPKTLLALATHIDPRDPYVAARDVATAPSTDTDDSLTEKETSPSEPQGSPPRDS